MLEADPIILERMHFPDPVISMSIEPQTPMTAKAWRRVGHHSTRDPSFRSEYNDETGETIIAGMGELHLEIIKNRLVRDMKIGVNVGQPKVSYRESLSGAANEVRGKFVKQTGGRGQYGDAVLTVKPMTPSEAEELGLEMKDGVAFRDSISQGVIPKEYIPSVEYGVRECAKAAFSAATPW